MIHDVIVVGGSYAGMAAALQLLRARRRVLVIDAGVRRNRFTDHSHGFLTRDGADPAEMARTARAQLEAYPTLDWIDARAETAEVTGTGFAVSTDDGARHEGSRILLALGVSDSLPPVEGLAERWGRSVFHCPYCHGYELDRGPIGLIASGPGSIQHAILIAEWVKVTLLLNGADLPLAEEIEALASRGITVEQAPIARIEGKADVRLADDRLLTFAGLFVVSRNAPSSSIADDLGCALEQTPFGTQIRTTRLPSATARWPGPRSTAR